MNSIDKGFGYYDSIVRDKNAEELTALLDRRIESVHLGNMSTYDEEQGSFRGYVTLTPEGALYHPCNLAPLVIIPGEIAYLSYQEDIDERDLTKVLSSLDWLRNHRGRELQPGITGILEDQEAKHSEAWVKYTAEAAIAEARMYQLLVKIGWPEPETEVHKNRAISYTEFLIAAARNGFAVKYSGSWEQKGWHTFGRAIRALDEVFAMTLERRYTTWALRYGNNLSKRLDELGGPFFRDEESELCFDSDISADPVRGLIRCYRLSGDEKYLRKAIEIGEWLMDKQLEDGAYPLRIFKNPNFNKATPNLDDLRRILEGRSEPGSALNLVGIASPGDTANITRALIKLWEATGNPDYITPINKGLAYCLYTQNMDESSPVFGLPPSWRPTKTELSPSWLSIDLTYSGDQGGLIEQMYLIYGDNKLQGYLI